MSYNISLNFSSILARLPGSRFLTLLRKGVYESPIDTLHPDATDVDELFVTESSLGGVDTPVAAAIDKLTSTPGAWAFFASGYMLGLLLMVSLTQSSFPNLICLEKNTLPRLSSYIACGMLLSPHEYQIDALDIPSIPRKLLSALSIIHTSLGDCYLAFYHWIYLGQPLALPCIYLQYISYARCFSFGASLYCKLASYPLHSMMPKKLLIGVFLAMSRDCLFGIAKRKWAISAGRLSAPFALRCWLRGS